MHFQAQHGYGRYTDTPVRCCCSSVFGADKPSTRLSPLVERAPVLPPRVDVATHGDIQVSKHEVFSLRRRQRYHKR